MLSADDREQLIRLRWLWDMHYDISTDGETWLAAPLADPEAVMTQPSSKALWMAIRVDNARRMSQAGSGGGRWIETASGPPFYVPPAIMPGFQDPG